MITLTGSKFSRSDNVVVRFDRSLIVAVSGFGSNREYAYFLSPTKSSVSNASAVSVDVSRDGGFTFMGSALFVFSDDAVVLRYAPSSGGVSGGTMITIEGSGFSADGAMCRFGGAPSRDVDATLLSERGLSCLVPESAAIPNQVSHAVMLLCAQQ